jgi:uncharacterized protein YjbJ (UPF0337 family)
MTSTSVPFAFNFAKPRPERRRAGVEHDRAREAFFLVAVGKPPKNRVRPGTALARAGSCRKGGVMSDRLRGKWKQLRGQIRRHWSKLGDSAIIEEASGNWDELAGRLQRRMVTSTKFKRVLQ